LKSKLYKFDLKAIEENCLEIYAQWKKKDNDKSRTDLFESIRELAFAVLRVGSYHKYNIDFEHVSYEYAIYLFERIIIGSLKLEPKSPEKHKIKKFPLQHYVRKNIKHVIFTLKDGGVWQELVTDLETFSDEDDIADSASLPPVLMDRRRFSAKLLDTLRIYYNYDDIRRLLPLSVEIIYEKWYQCFGNDVPVDLRDFTTILVASAKRVARIENLFYSTNLKKKDLKQALGAAVRSTIFLSAIANNDIFPRELLLSLDIDSLYRMVSVLGGKTIKVPTQKELETLLGGVSAVSKVILEGKDQTKALKETKADYQLVFSSFINVHHFISKAVESFSLGSENGISEPIINMLITSISSLDVMFRKLDKNLGSMPQESILRQYCEISDSFSKLTESIVKISSLENRNYGQSDLHLQE